MINRPSRWVAARDPFAATLRCPTKAYGPKPRICAPSLPATTILRWALGVAGALIVGKALLGVLA